MKRHVLIFGLVGGLLIAALQYTEYRFVIIEHSVELYSALVAILFATFGIWLGLRITRRRETIRETVVVREVLVPAEAPALEPFAPNTAHQQTLGITAREYVAMWEVLYFNFMPHFMDSYFAAQIHKVQSSGLDPATTAAKVAAIQHSQQLYQNPFVNMAYTFMEPLPVGLIITLISAAVLRRKAPVGPTAAPAVMTT
jgi:Protein of unknown function (DUF4199)